MTPADYGVRAATKFNANNPGHFPGRPLFEGLVARAVEDALKAYRAAVLARLLELRQGPGWGDEEVMAEAIRDLPLEGKP